MTFLHHVKERYTHDTAWYQLLSQIYQTELTYNEQALEYCASRNMTQDTMRAFAIGYAPGSDTQLAQLIASEFPADFLERNGIAYPEARYCKFDSRIMFPYHDLRGNVVGMSGRIIPPADAKLRKYVHTSNTAVYQKSLYMYGMYQAIPHIRTKGYVVIVEGNVDVLALAQSGVQNVVACSGTAFTPQYLQMLRTYTDTFLFWFDNDDAGEEGWNRAECLCDDFGVVCRRIYEDSGHDPDAISCIISPEDIQHVVREAYEQTQ